MTSPTKIISIRGNKATRMMRSMAPEAFALSQYNGSIEVSNSAEHFHNNKPNTIINKMVGLYVSNGKRVASMQQSLSLNTRQASKHSTPSRAIGRNFHIIPKTSSSVSHNSNGKVRNKANIHMKNYTQKKYITNYLHEKKMINLYDKCSLKVNKRGAIVITKYSYCSRTGMLPNNTSKINQDSFFVKINLLNNPRQHLFGVADGHGKFGKEISSFIEHTFPSIIFLY